MDSTFIYAFHVDDHEPDATEIRCYGIDSQKKNTCLRIQDFTPYVYIELPTKFVRWNDEKAQKVGRALDELLRDSKPVDKPNGQPGYHFTWRKMLYRPQIKNGKPNNFPVIFCKFAVKKHIWHLRSQLYKPIYVPTLGKLKLELHEANADEILQLVCTLDIPTCGWIKYSGQECLAKKTSSDKEVVVKYRDIKPVRDCTASVNPLIMSFDIEAYSHRKGVFPCAKHPKDRVFMISCVFFRNDSDARTVREVLLTLGRPRDEDVGAECITFTTEGSLIEGFSRLIQTMNPHIITGWNIMGFDIEYLITRSQLTGDFDQLGLAGMHLERASREIKEVHWKNAGRGTQHFQYLEWEGRILVDLLPVIKSDHKLNNYKLDTVSKHFLGDDVGKEDLPVEQLFECYRIGVANKSQWDTDAARDATSKAGKYCMVDSRLVAKLFVKTDTWFGLSELATTCNVPVMDLIIKGQQKRVFSNIYSFCNKAGIVVQSNGYKAGENERYVGAHVHTPKPGLYRNVVPFDFASLYPTTIIAYNIDYSTLVKDPSIPDSKCHVLEWEDHLGCEHDPKVKRLKELTDFITAKEETVRRLRILRDRMRIVDFIPGYKRGCHYSKQLRNAARIGRDREKRKLNKKIKKITEELKPYREERVEVKKGIPKMRMCEKRHYRFLKEPKGVVPTVLEKLLQSRKDTRALKRKLEKQVGDMDEEERYNTNILINVLEQRQKAKKVVCNSMYGAMGVREGYLPFMPGAMCTTALGRRNNKLAAKVLVEKWNGKLIYGDTDSSYIFFPDVVGKTREETAALLWDHSEVVADDLTSIFPPPMKLEFEEVIYHDFLILSKKRYVYTPMKRDGKLSSKVGNKGVLLSRRDNSDVVRDVYAGLVKRIFNRLPEEENLNWLVEKALEMFQKQVPIEKFTITKKIGEVGSLPLLTDCNGVCQEWVRSIESGGGNQSEEMKKILESGKVLVGDYTIPKLSRDPKERARQLKMKNSSSPVEYYTNSLPAHVSLAMKMRARGTRVDNGTRLLHIVIEAAGHKDKLFNKIEDVEYLQKHTRRWALDGMRVDGLYYLKAMTKSIDQVLNACYESKSAKNFMTRLYKHWLARYDTVNKISPYTKIVFNDQ